MLQAGGSPSTRGVRDGLWCSKTPIRQDAARRQLNGVGGQPSADSDLHRISRQIERNFATSPLTSRPDPIFVNCAVCAFHSASLFGGAEYIAACRSVPHCKSTWCGSIKGRSP